MGTVNSRDGKLYLDFRYKGVRCREQTSLVDNSANRQKLNRLLTLLEQQMKAGSFDYRHHFPDSPKAEYFRQLTKVSQLKASEGRMLFGTFANLWLVEKRVEWRASQIETVEGILRCHLLPAMGDSMIATIRVC